MIARTIEYVAQQLIQGYKSGDNVTQAFLNNYDFYIFPFVNPDGMNCFVDVATNSDTFF
jgi:murein tripeptide amidase MpaA